MAMQDPRSRVVSTETDLDIRLGIIRAGGDGNDVTEKGVDRVLRVVPG